MSIEARRLRIYASGGGRVYHTDLECENLAAGKELVRERGGKEEPVRLISWDDASLRGLTRCGRCCPAELP